jgi:hypothetical protein
MNEIAFFLLTFLGISFAKSDKATVQKSEVVQLVRPDPGQGTNALNMQSFV